MTSGCLSGGLNWVWSPKMQVHMFWSFRYFNFGKANATKQL